MVIYMHEHKSTPAAVAQYRSYGDEIMNSNWNPAVVHLVDDATRNANIPELPEDFSTADADAFLDRVYALATQI